VLAVVAELDARHDLGVAEHGGHALPAHVVVDGKGLETNLPISFRRNLRVKF
jgi:hypothetical protein